MQIRARSAVVLAAGGFESNLEWLKEIWGDAADNFIVRGTPYNTGTVLRADARCGRASRSATRRSVHAVAIDARAPKFDGGIVTRLDCVPLGIVVNKHGERFYDEGEDFWPKRYAIWGRLVAQQPDQIAYSIVDAKSCGRFMPSVFPPIAAQIDPRARARLDRRPAARSSATVERVQRAVRPGTFDHQALDDCRTEGLVPNKTHWAQPHRHAAVLRLSAAAGHHVHVPRREGGRACARADEGRRPRAEHLRGRRDHGRQHPRAGLRRRRRHDDRHRVRRDRGARRPAPLLDRAEPTRSQGRQHEMTVCNACRYCEAYCPVFQAMEERRDVLAGRRRVPRESLPQLRRVPVRVPVRAAARVRHQRPARAR